MSNRALRSYFQHGAPLELTTLLQLDSRAVTNALEMTEDEDNDSYAPWNFSWLVPGQIALMAHPRNEANMRWIWSQGIRHLLTLSSEKRPPLYATPKMQWSEITVSEFEPPTMCQIKRFIEICQRCMLKNEPLGVHCRQGLGRTGVMAACYLVHFQNLGPERAIINLRRLRPHSIETPEQEEAVVRYHDCVKNMQTTFEGKPFYFRNGSWLSGYSTFEILISSFSTVKELLAEGRGGELLRNKERLKMKEIRANSLCFSCNFFEIPCLCEPSKNPTRFEDQHPRRNCQHNICYANKSHDKRQKSVYAMYGEWGTSPNRFDLQNNVNKNFKHEPKL